MNDWKYLFRPHILERGFDYYVVGAVDEVERTKTGYRANVEGTEDYGVEIELRDGDVYDMNCTCPYAQDDKYCKHMAAVLYEIEERERDLEMSQKSRNEKCGDSGNELRDVIDEIPENELRDLLECIALENEKLRNQILIRYSRTISQGQMVMLKNEIAEIAKRYSDRGGYVDWRNAGGYISEMEAFLRDKVQEIIEKGCYMQAFELTNHVFVTIGNQGIDDSDGGTSMAADLCYECWQQILEKCSEQDKTKMRAWFEKHQSDGIVIDYMEDYIREFLLNELHDKKLLTKEIQRLDEVIENRGDSTDCGTYYSVYSGDVNNIRKRIQFMKALGATEEEIRRYREKNRRFAAVRMLEIEEFIRAGNNMDAVRVLKESKELDQISQGWVKGYSRKLIELYSQMHMEKEYKEELLFQVFSCAQDSLDFIKKLKAVCNREEWEQNREKLLAAPVGMAVKLHLLESEELYDRLLEEVLNSGSVYWLDSFEKRLNKIYPDRMMEAYIIYIKKEAGTAHNRSDYKELMKYLKKITSYPQGREAAAQLAGEWKTLYKRRPAMMDELRRAGF
ncbi:hypothetical protein C0033_07120 [Clostridium sp. chh4-2]|uniref:SWIM zinc finger family protein n=1 Tax=Clostridium sp. chh4-2 TaxID=2067550 RepID=UPI000CCF2040|nr:SWIM zinc finger family protein [Clostridium sp. chh4-2]PNV62788.1 hypothetical protein C0033_07120 [Clostridium sp. chh4-2]